MYQPLHNRFRIDLSISQTINKETLAKCYVVKDPNSGETFEFGEEEYFLCQSMNGTSLVPQILVEFKNHFNLSITKEDFKEFSAQIADFGLLEEYNAPDLSSLPASLSFNQDLLVQDLSTKTREENYQLDQLDQLAVEPEAQFQDKKKKKLLWSLHNPDKFFVEIVHFVEPLRPFFQILIFVLIPGLVLALFTIFNNSSVFRREIAFAVKPAPLLVSSLLVLTTVNLTSRLAQGTICAYYGASIKQFGLKLRLGFVPRFYISKNGIWKLNREEQLWAFGTPLLVRIFLFVLGTLTWYLTRGSGTELKLWALSIGYLGLINFLINCSPFWPSDGFGWIIAYFRLSPRFFKQNLLVWEMMLNRRSLPKWLSRQEKIKLQAFSLVTVITWALLAFKIAYSFGLGVINSISPGILGEGATILLLLVFFAIALRWWLDAQGKGKTIRKNESKIVTSSQRREVLSQSESLNEWDIEPISLPTSARSRQKRANILQKHGRKVLIMGGCAIILSLPYPYRPGGAIELLPPKQQQIQAPVEGKLTKVFFPGGDGGWLKAGTVIANLEAVDLENTVLTSQEQVKQQQADLAKAQAVLSKLLAMPKPEDVAVAQQQVNVAQQQVNVAQQQVNVAQQELQNAKVKAQFSARQAARYKDLYSTGAFSLQQYENAQKEAQSDRTTVAQQQQSVAVAQQDVETNKQKAKQAQANKKLVMSGPYPQDIEAARQEVAAARANLKRLEQLLKYNQDQFRRTALVMPIDGYLITPYLQQKVGSFLKLGETFAVAEDNRHIQGQVQVPEYDVGEFSVGAQAEVKLIAYAGKPLLGKVVAIEPTTITDSAFEVSAKAEDEDTSRDEPRFVRVVVDLPNTQNVLKARMSGYAKLEGRTMPVLLAFTRSLVRFVEIELWSWLP
jgi:multidrug resistance efflux pump